MYRFYASREANTSCSVCRSGAVEEIEHGGAINLVCPICGRYRLQRTVPVLVPDWSTEGRPSYKLAHFLRSVAERAIGKYDESYFPVYSTEDLQQVLDSKDPTIIEKSYLLLKYIANLSQHPGDWISFDSFYDYPILCGKNQGEAQFFLNTLIEQGSLTTQTGGLSNNVQVTSEGWQALERHENAGAVSEKAFIAMKFHPSRDLAKNAIKDAISNAGYRPLRLDEFEHVNRIDDEIIAQIRGSKFLVADFTHQSNGVYFEAGFMLGLGRPVIWLCDKSDKNNLHFDTRQYNTIEYTSPENLKKQLQLRIEAILGKGPIENK